MDAKGLTAIVTGGSSGIGACTAFSLARAGCTVYDLSRHGEDCGPVRHISADVTDEESVERAVDMVMAERGRIDILVNNAGFGISGAVEFTSGNDAKRLMDVNLFGMANMIKAVLPVMRGQRSGRIVNISSVAAPVAIPFQAWYSASKAAVVALSSALAGEVAPFGVSVCAVMPGDIKTNFTASREKSREGDDIYGGRIARSVGRMEKDERSGMAPERAGEFICRTALRRRVKPVYTIGASYKAVTLLARLLPASVLSKIVYKLYA